MDFRQRDFDESLEEKAEDYENRMDVKDFTLNVVRGRLRGEWVLILNFSIIFFIIVGNFHFRLTSA